MVDSWDFFLSLLFILMLRTWSCSFQGKTVKNAGWDFSIGGSQGGGTVRALKPPQARERRQEVSSNQTFQKTSRASGGQLSSSSGSAVPEMSEGSFVKRDSYQHDFEEEVRSYISPDTILFYQTLHGKLLEYIMICCFQVTWLTIFGLI